MKFSSTFDPRKRIGPAVAGIGFKFVFPGGFLLALSRLFIVDEPLRNGFVIMAAVPPAVAVIPFGLILKGNEGPFAIGRPGP